MLDAVRALAERRVGGHQEVDPVPLVQGPYERYGVHFLVPADAALGQGTYRVEHPAVGAVDVFVVPTAHTGDGLVLTATFVRGAGTIVGEPATLAPEAGSP
ncbi:hypothetical protein GCM10009557_95080 [Virgisporangium ochraceum]